MKIPDIAWPTFFESYRESMLKNVQIKTFVLLFFLLLVHDLNAITALYDFTLLVGVNYYLLRTQYKNEMINIVFMI